MTQESESSNLALIEELESRGFIVVPESEPKILLEHIHDDDLLREIDERDIGEVSVSDADIDDLITEIELRGFYVTPTNEENNLWDDIYYFTVANSPENVVDYLNKIFVEKLGKWI